MKCVVIFVSLVGLAIAGDSIDYSDCNWHWGDKGQTISCPAGYVGVGACGSKGAPHCRNRATGVECCKIRGATEAPSECVTLTGDHGSHPQCPFGTQVFNTCGSLDWRRCQYDGTNFSIRIDCCRSGLVVDAEKCAWKYGDNGHELSCEKFAGGEEVLMGRCGSGSSRKCNNLVHGIRCCQIVL